ncbi:MAG: PilZ domain-containing protein [Parvularculaceae bacterium]
MDAKQNTPQRDGRSSFRFPARMPVDILRGNERHSYGQLVDMSRDGAALKAFVPLNMGTAYEFHIRGVGRMPGTIVRRFNGEHYGVRFDIDEASRRRIDAVLGAMLDAGIVEQAPANSERA